MWLRARAAAPVVGLVTVVLAVVVTVAGGASVAVVVVGTACSVGVVVTVVESVAGTVLAGGFSVPRVVRRCGVLAQRRRSIRTRSAVASAEPRGIDSTAQRRIGTRPHRVKREMLPLPSVAAWPLMAFAVNAK